MDVRCEACQTEYEFDDALVTGKGTSVKCTNCGHQFRIQAVGGDDKWIIETANGRSLTFTSMRELQRGIASRMVGRDDTLVRGDTRRLLGAIVELIPFFDEQPRAPKTTLIGPIMPGQVTTGAPPPLPPGASRPPPGHLPQSPPALLTDPRVDAPAHHGASQTPSPVHASTHANGPSNHPSHGPNNGLPPPRSRMPSIPPPLPMRSRTATLRPAEGVAPPPMPTVKRLKDDQKMDMRVPPPHAPDSEPGSTQRYERNSRPPPPPVASIPPPRPPPPDIEVEPRSGGARADVSSPLPPPSRSKQSQRRALPSEPDDGPAAKLSEELSAPAKKRSSGYVVALLLVAGLGGGAFYWNRSHPFLHADTPVASASGALDPRAQEYLTAGDRALAEGNLELAREKLDKASALAEKDPRVLLSEAQLQNALAEVPWLKLRILAPDAKDDQNLAKRDLEDATARAKKAADDASAADTASVGALRARVDAYRLASDKGKAVSLASDLAAKSKDADSAYVLAMVDLVDPQSTPTPQTVSRLREATEVDTSGRSRAALVYALAASGDPLAAKAELDKLVARERPHPLTSALRGFIARAPNKMGDGGAHIAMNDPTAPAGSGVTGVNGATGANGANGGATGAANPNGGGADVPLPAGDSRSLVAEGEKARQRGDYGRARKAYEAALEKNPYDSEALTGLGEVAHAERDLGGASAEFKRAIQVNPRYLPALVGLGDVQWESGDTAAGQRTYKEIVDNYPDVAYPARVKERSEAKAPAPPPPTAPTPTAPAPQPPQPPQPPTPPAPPTASAGAP